MTDTKLLKSKIEGSGLKLCFIADKVGITRQALYKKINGQVPFNQFEIERMCAALDVKTLTEKEALFFAKDVS